MFSPTIINDPGIENWDTSLMRNFKEREWLKIQLRGEFYNTFNRPNLSNPDTSLTNLNTFGKVTGSNSGRNMKLALIFFF